MNYLDWLDKYRPDVGMRKRVGRSKEFHANKLFVDEGWRILQNKYDNADDLLDRATAVIDLADFNRTNAFKEWFTTDQVFYPEPFTREDFAAAMAYVLVQRGWKAKPLYMHDVWMVEVNYGRMH